MHFCENALAKLTCLDVPVKKVFVVQFAACSVSAQVVFLIRAHVAFKYVSMY